MCTLSCGVKTVSLLSCLLAAAVVVSGGLLLKTSYEERDKTVSSIVGGVESVVKSAGSDYGTVYGSTTYWNTLLSVTAVSVAAAALQLLTSLFLLLCATSKGGRISAKIWVGVNFFVILAIASSIVCLMWQKVFRNRAEEAEDKQLVAFLGAAAADVVFLFLFMFINCAFSCRSSSS